MNKMLLIRFLSLCLLFVVTGCNDGSSNSSSEQSWIVRWNKIAIDASGRDHATDGAGEQFGPVRSIRAMAIVHVAMADVVAVVTKRFRPYTSLVSTEDNASLKAALAQAAHDTLVSLFPSQAPVFAQELQKSLNEEADGLAREAGVRLGKASAAEILAIRTGDGSELSEPYVPISYQPSSEPGKWRPDPINPNQKGIGASWYKVIPFVITDAAQFRLPPPPALNSAEYAAAFNEVKRLGGDGIVTPTERTEEQTQIGIFWAYDGTPSLCAPPRLYNQIAVKIAKDHGLDLPDMARLLVLVNLAMSDAGIASWDSKYAYEYWRPVTGIREADPGTGPTGRGDGNRLTQGDINFTPLGAPASNLSANNFTPPFPAYSSGHATFGGALFQTMRHFFGTDDIAFSFVSDELNGVTRDNQGNVRPLVERHFDTLSQAEDENGQSRIYLGIHWSFDKTSGITQGRQVADWVYANAYQPLS
jgi:hypothetical protein